MRRSSKDFFDAIREFPHNIGIYLTYTLDEQVIEKLSENSNGTILILHDYTQGINLEYNKDSAIRCIPINTSNPKMKNCFHAKLVLLKSSEDAKLILGSVNLSKNSFSSEKEIAFEKELNFANPEDMYIYNKVLSFLQDLRNQIPVSKEELQQVLEKLEYKDLKEKPGEIEFILNSENESMFDHIKSFVNKFCNNENAIDIKIVTPFISDKYLNLEELKLISPDISIYLRTGAKIDAFKNHFKIYQPADKKRKGFHAKIILIEYEKYSVIYIGSANFSQQGFFQNTRQFSNQECGIIVKTGKDEINHWFNEKNWKQITDPDNYKESDENSVECLHYNDQPYAWTSKKDTFITTYIYNPGRHQYVYQKEKKIKLVIEKEELNFYKTNELEISDKIENLIIFKIGREEIKTSVFDFEMFNSNCDRNSESIFETFKGIYSVNPTEVDKAIEKDKLTVNVTSTRVNITEPPKLEQYFYNVKDLINKIAQKKYFSEYNFKEICNEISKSKDGRVMYLTLHLLKVFKHKNDSVRFVRLLEEKVAELAEELGLDQKKLNRFIEKWSE